MKTQTTLIDVMEHGRFLCQVRYTYTPKWKIIGGELKPTLDMNEALRNIRKQRPSLKNRDINIAPSTQFAPAPQWK